MRSGYKVRVSHPSAQPNAFINTSVSGDREFAGKDESDADNDEDSETPDSLVRLYEFAKTQGDISHLLDESVINRIGVDAVRQWKIDEGSRSGWMKTAERALSIAAQESDDEDSTKDYPFEGASDIHYPILTTAAQQFAARAYPALVKGDKVVGVKIFQPPSIQPSVQDQAQAGLQPTSPEQAQEMSVQLQAAKDQEQKVSLENQAKAARAERVKHYLNWQVFYKMANWETETDALLHEAPVVGAGFKKIYFDENGLQSDYISSTRLTVNNNTKSIYRCPRITHDFDAYPYEIAQKQRSGEYREYDIPETDVDPEDSVLLIEQYRFEDLDDDGLQEPYLVTVYEKTNAVLRIEPAYTFDDIIIDEIDNKVVKIERWLGYSEFFFLPDPKGRYYGIGFGRLLQAICDSIDTSINQLVDAGNAEIAGGGFIAAGVRLQGSGQGGTIYQRPGEYQTVSTPGGDLKQAIWERTLPHPSQITYNLLELLLGAAKDIASIKDVITGNTPATAPVGTTLALQDQALQVFSAIYQRMYRGFHHEFYLMYKAIKRWSTDKDRIQYKELTGGNLDEDFSGDGTDIQPIADPAVVTKQQKIARIQTLIQLAESPVGMAAGMTQAGPAQEIAKEALNAMDWDRPERFLAEVPPNPEMAAKVADLQASAEQKQAKARSEMAGANLDTAKVTTENSISNLHQAKALREVGLASHDVHSLDRLVGGLPAENPTIDEHGQLPGTSPQIEAMQPQVPVQGQTLSNAVPQHRAKGGPVNPGQPYIVGEKGQEMFVPTQPGVIIPNNKLGNSTQPLDMTNQYNTTLRPDEEMKYQQWASANGRQNDTRDYDLRGAWQAGAQQADNGHFPDTYKKPNHPTFSDESQYNNTDGYIGGSWVQMGPDKWAYSASPTNIQMYGASGLHQYFQNTEPDSELRLPVQTQGQ